VGDFGGIVQQKNLVQLSSLMSRLVSSVFLNTHTHTHTLGNFEINKVQLSSLMYEVKPRHARHAPSCVCW
jgi:hypothetical protein